MLLGRVQGHVVASQKDPAMQGCRMLLVEPVKIDYDDAGGGTMQPTGRALVAVDRIGAGEGQIVMLVQGSSARMTEGCAKMPVDAVIVGLVDEAFVKDKRLDPGALDPATR
ncbi:MAG: ethanolamine utilization protein EutN [Alphaproteobacteria bacterium]|jgi:ethanolamine utilization protein EutN|nr:ethanolamine utilization protein EutN [Alphaproteobacteria bacterium]